MSTTSTVPADRPWSGRSAHWGSKYQRQCLLSAVVNEDGSITGIAAGHDNGFTSSPDRLVTIPASQVRKLRVKVLTR